MTVFTVDPDHKVHVKGCPHSSERAVPYKTGPQTPSDMHRHLSRPDSSGGMISVRHDGRPKLFPCAKCVTAMATEENQ